MVVPEGQLGNAVKLVALDSLCTGTVLALLMYCTSASIVAVTGVIDDADSELLNFCDRAPLDNSKMSKVSSTTNTVSKPVRASMTHGKLRVDCKVA